MNSHWITLALKIRSVTSDGMTCILSFVIGRFFQKLLQARSHARAAMLLL